MNIPRKSEDMSLMGRCVDVLSIMEDLGKSCISVLPVEGLGFNASYQTLLYSLISCQNSDRLIPDYSFTLAGGISAISIVASVDPAIDVQCHRYSTGSYSQQYSSYSYVGYVSQIGDSNSDCTDSSGQPIDFIALYDNKQLLGYNSASCMELCQNVVGMGLLGITIVRNPDATIPTAPYTGGGDYQCQCHALLTGPSDPKILTAQNYPYPAGQGFASAASAQPGKVVAGTFQPGTSTSALCYRVTPPSMTFTGEGSCSDTDGNQYEFYTLKNPSGAPVTDCASQCDALAQSFYAFDYPEAVRGFEYDGNCKCIVDSGYGVRQLSSDKLGIPCKHILFYSRSSLCFFLAL